MVTFLLLIIYLAFISLGLPESLLGSAWPVMHISLGTDARFLGVATFIIAGGMVIAGIVSNRLLKRFGAGTVSAVGALATALSLIGFSNATTFWMFCLFAIPYGLAAGSIDAALNNYVSQHYNSRQMSWLHGFWGVGAIISPYIMGFSLEREYGWEHGYFTVAMIQVAIVIILFVCLPIWKKLNGRVPAAEESERLLTLSEVLKIKGVKLVLPAFFAYCAVEATTMHWASTYLFLHRGIPGESAARYGALFYWGLTGGRFLGGFIANKMGDRKMIRVSTVIIFAGIFMLLLPFEADMVSLIGLVVLGLGTATVFPSIIHSAPANFGKENAQAVIGVQMAGAYAGITLMPLLFGIISPITGMGIYPVFMLVFTVVFVILIELLNKCVDKERRKKTNA